MTIRNSAIDFALALISTIRHPGEVLTLRQIADVTNMLHDEGFGVGRFTHQDALYIERRALKKLAQAMLKSGCLDREDRGKLGALFRNPKRRYLGVLR